MNGLVFDRMRSVFFSYLGLNFKGPCREVQGGCESKSETSVDWFRCGSVLADRAHQSFRFLQRALFISLLYIYLLLFADKQPQR